MQSGAEGTIHAAIPIGDLADQCYKPALVTYVTAGYPTIAETPDILLGMEAGGADIIELGMPFTDPIADGPTIQLSNTACYAQLLMKPSLLTIKFTASSPERSEFQHVLRYGSSGSTTRPAGTNPPYGLLQSVAKLRRSKNA